LIIARRDQPGFVALVGHENRHEVGQGRGFRQTSAIWPDAYTEVRASLGVLPVTPRQITKREP